MTWWQYVGLAVSVGLIVGGLIGLGRFLGSHIVATAYIGVPVECTNCVNEADRG